MKNVELDLSKHIGKSYEEVYKHAALGDFIHFWLKGGRGSLKSAFACLFVIYCMTCEHLTGKTTHCVALRKVKDTIKDSIFENLLWAIDMLGVGSLWKHTVSPMKIWIGDSVILFRGCNNKRDYEKIKSIKIKRGFIKYALFEEVTEFFGMTEILSILQSLFRGTNEALAFYMYNPPPSKSNWVNKEVKKEEPNRFVHHSTYKEAPPEWLGSVFLEEAEKLKEYNPRQYKHMLLGEEIGEGLEIYPPLTPDNPEGLVEYRTITNEELEECVKIDRGFDFGSTHASCYSEMFYNKEKRWIYIIDEVYLYGASNYYLAEKTKEKAGSNYIIGDCANKNLIRELNLLGLNIGKCKKGPDSLSHGILWIKGQNRIIIDKKRTPYIANDFETYEYKKDKEGNIIHDFHEIHEPDGCASVRYGLQRHILKNEIIFGGKRR